MRVAVAPADVATDRANPASCACDGRWRRREIAQAGELAPMVQATGVDRHAHKRGCCRRAVVTDAGCRSPASVGSGCRSRRACAGWRAIGGRLLLGAAPGVAAGGAGRLPAGVAGPLARSRTARSLLILDRRDSEPVRHGSSSRPSAETKFGTSDRLLTATGQTFPLTALGTRGEYGLRAQDEPRTVAHGCCEICDGQKLSV